LAYRLLKLRLSTRIALLAIVFAIPFALKAQETPVEAWWIRANFTPTELAYESMPVSEINRDWVKISILSDASLPPKAKADLGWMHREGFAFEVDNYFRRKGLSDRELCGVFEDRDGRKGRFLMVLEKSKGRKWKVAFLHTEIGEPGFSVLVRKSTGLFWGVCMQCDEFSRLRLKHGAFQLESAP